MALRHSTEEECDGHEIRTHSAEELNEIDPLKDPRWDILINQHRNASVFHSTAWLQALRETYDYEPIAFTTSRPNEPLANGFLFCKINSWVTGRRLVSVPFADYCELLCPTDQDLEFFVNALECEIRKKRLRYVELRACTSAANIGYFYPQFVTYTLHRLDLLPDLSTIFRNFHKNSIQRKIRRSEREGLVYDEGSTEELFNSFYRLLVVTRRRHSVPPQPRKWFQNLAKCFGSDLKIRIASKHGQAVAGIITIRHKDVLYYKYGGSDERFHRFGGMHLLYWRAIQDAKHSGLRVFDLGRTDLDQPGLITFKGRWGASVSSLAYRRIALSGAGTHCFEPGVHQTSRRIAAALFACSPPRLLSALGSVLYKHIG